ncbi:MAG TPA: acyl-CoA dehydrogenase family protein [Solimonas sp.]|nr:acyl-CoA dehydrogenase family protein [Solimonas sp.]
MDFRPSQEQVLLRDSVRRYFENAGDDADDDTRDWRQFADFGWLAMPVPEADGGLDAGLVDLAIVCEEIGAALARAPFVAGAVLPARVVARCPAAAARTAILSALADGTQRYALAAYEAPRRYELSSPATRAERAADGRYRISGGKTLVAGGAQADRLLVTAAIGSDARPALFVVDARAAGVRRRVYAAVDGLPVADFEFAAVDAGAPLALPDAAPSALDAALDEATICLCADLIGGIDQAVRQTAAYLRLRKQFGRPLAEFQALQHTVAEMSIEANSARSLLYRAIAAHGTDDAAQRVRAVAGCAIKTQQVAKWVAGTAVHLHGGIGMTCEYAVGRHLLRALVGERLLADREHQLARYLS